MRAHCGKNDNRLNNPGERRGFGEGRLQRAPGDTARRLHAKGFVRVSTGLGEAGARGCAQLVEVVTAAAVPGQQHHTQKVLTLAHGCSPFPECSPKSPLVLDRSMPQTELRWTSQLPPNCSHQPVPCPSSPSAMSPHRGSAPPKWAQRGHGAAGHHHSQPAPTGVSPKHHLWGTGWGAKPDF